MSIIKYIAMGITITVMVWSSVILFQLIDGSKEYSESHKMLRMTLCVMMPKIPFDLHNPEFINHHYFLEENCCSPLKEEEIADYYIAKYLNHTEKELSEKKENFDNYILRLREAFPGFKGIANVMFVHVPKSNYMLIYFLSVLENTADCEQFYNTSKLLEHIQDENEAVSNISIGTSTPATTTDDETLNVRKCIMNPEIPFDLYNPKFVDHHSFNEDKCCASLEEELADYYVAKYSNHTDQELNEKKEAFDNYVLRLRQEFPGFKGIADIEIEPVPEYTFLRIRFNVVLQKTLDCVLLFNKTMLWEQIRNENKSVSKISTNISDENMHVNECVIIPKMPFDVYNATFFHHALPHDKCCCSIEKQLADYYVAKYLNYTEKELDEKKETLDYYVLRLREVFSGFKGISNVKLDPVPEKNYTIIRFLMMLEEAVECEELYNNSVLLGQTYFDIDLPEPE